MSKVLLALTSAALLGLSGCADMQTSKAPAEAAKPTISAEAQAALTKAQADVKMAISKNALWTTAKDNLKDAEEAAKKGDSATVLKESKLVSDHVAKAMVQLTYPMLKVGD
jgi:murein lipoprotein